MTPEKRVWLVLTVLAARWEADNSHDREGGLEHVALIDARDELVRRGLAVGLPDGDLWPSQVASADGAS